VDFNEFLRMMTRSQYHINRVQGHAGEHGRSPDEMEEMRQAFRVFDIDGNGVIDEHELKTTMFNLGEDLSDQEVKQMIKLADRNGDGKIDYEGIGLPMSGVVRPEQQTSSCSPAACIQPN